MARPPRDLRGTEIGSLRPVRIVPEKTKHGESIWECLCVCGKTVRRPHYQLINSYRPHQSCGCQRRNVGPRPKDIRGLKFGMLTAIEPTGKRNHYGIVWRALCDCGNEVERGASELIRKPRRLTQVPKNCGCYRKVNRSLKYKGIGDLSSTYFRRVKSGAKQRGLPFEITIGQAWGLFVAQGGRCALTGLRLKLNPSSMVAGSSTASLDRIDSTKGYVKGNIQWVHVTINFMKYSLPEEEFIRWCHLVIKHRG